MGKNRGARIIITLECSCKNLQNINEYRKQGSFRYTTSKNRRNTVNRLELKKFCPICNRHMKFREIK